ncbi:MFS transporter [Roseiterribacter gracilis]|uniref:MFS transporter n=1 Tax=Roseiterribacter gracilis TaxID=2812848 RepID=A0A8S8XIM9_9PROT|nr:MFS transporter [Rhodospirillales bacterium TMPK1]
MTDIQADGVRVQREQGTAFAVLAALSLCHGLNDLGQSLLPAIYPLLKESYALDFGEIGLITLAFQFTASLLQPLVGLATDRRPRPWSLPVGMGVSLVGLLLLSAANSFPLILLAAALVGTGSSIFHPESSRVARLASGGRHGLAQSLFQVGGNVGSAAGPLAAAFIVLQRGQGSVAWFSLTALLALIVLIFVSRWYGAHLRATAKRATGAVATLPRKTVVRGIVVLLALVFSKYVYTASLSSYFTFYLIHRFGVSVQTAQLCLFAFLGAYAAGTLLGGPIGDRIGRKKVIWVSILGALPFTLVLPHVGLTATVVLAIVIGFVISSAFSAIVVFAQELMPGKVGTVAGLFFGFAFGMGGLGAAALGALADHTSIEFVYRVCAYLPALGLLAAFLPDPKRGVQPA